MEMKIKIKMRSNFTPTRLAMMMMMMIMVTRIRGRGRKITGVDEDVEKLDSHTFWWECKTMHHCESSFQSLKKMSRLATQTSNSTHRYRSKIIENILKQIYKYVHSSTVHNSQKTEITKIPLRGEWINKMKYVHSTEYYSVVNTNEILTHTNCR